MTVNAESGVRSCRFPGLRIPLEPRSSLVARVQRTLQGAQVQNARDSFGRAACEIMFDADLDAASKQVRVERLAGEYLTLVAPMTFDDDYAYLHLRDRSTTVYLGAVGLEWPPPVRHEWVPGEGEMVRYRMSNLTDAERERMTSVCRGAEYFYPDHLPLYGDTDADADLDEEE